MAVSAESWLEWGPEAFSRAKAEKKPILAAAGSRPPEVLVSTDVASRFIAVLADPEARPDAAARIGCGAVVVLDGDGARRGSATLSSPALADDLKRLAAEASSPLPPTESGPAWNGAVRESTPPASLQAADVSAVLAEVVSTPGAFDAVTIEVLLHAAGEREDAAARRALDQALTASWDSLRRAPVDESGSPLSRAARWSSLYWDAHAMTGEARWREAAALVTSYLLDALWDGKVGAFRRLPQPDSCVYPADGNAFAVSALIRANAFGHPGAADAATKTLGFLQTRLYDPLLGLQHSAGDGGESVVGQLGDAAATALAFTDAFFATGIKAHREFADAMLRFLFQELWDRDGGGFLDRVVRVGDPAILREPVVDPRLNALALEVCRRLHHLKGNHNYRRWLEWGLRGAWAKGADARSRAALARVADLHALGRMDFELVGRPGETKTETLLAALHRLYLPRKNVSFVDPDDQDYILAHKLETDAYPRLFGCGADLRKLADAGEAAEVPAVCAALRGEKK